MNARMGVMSVMIRADNTGAKNLDIMIVKSISIRQQRRSDREREGR